MNLPSWLETLAKRHRDGMYIGRPKRFLVIDDEHAVAVMMKTGITQAGHKCDTAIGEDDAWSQLQHNTYDYVVTDLRLSGRQDHGLGSRATGVLSTGGAEDAGARLLQDLRTASSIAPCNRRAKTILMTGNPYVGARDFRSDPPEGVDLVLAKPITPRQLLDQALQLTTRRHGRS